MTTLSRASCLNNLGWSHFNLGNAYAGQKNYGDAITQFRLASKVVPDWVRSELEGLLGIKLLMHAVDIESKEKVEFLVVNGADIDTREPYVLETALMRAKSVEMAGFLLDVGADINAKNKYGETPLEFFMGRYIESDSKGSLDMVALLLARGADVNAVDKGGKTALMKAVESFQGNEYYLEQLKSRVALLINSGADIGIKDKEGRTVFNLCKQEDLRQFILDAHQQYSSGGIDLK